MDPEYKRLKEQSVQLLSGGGIWEINHVTLVAPAAALLWSVLQKRQSFFKPYTAPAALVDFLLHCCTILFATTVYSSAPQVLNGLLFLPTLATLLQSPGKSEQSSKTGKSSEANGKPAEAKNETIESDLDPLPVKPFITTYRGAMMIVTCTSILAVDFPAFPRRFAKTESFGTSLMDLGVGSFVFAAGIVAARQHLKEELNGYPSLKSRFISAMRHSLPLFVLGFVRLWSVKGLDYPEHVSEYGVHWNFFFTLALLPPAMAILQPLLRRSPSYGLVAFVLAILYEILLTPARKSYIILAERKPDDWLSQNREGVFSFIGYLAIFIGGMGIGTGILPRSSEPESQERTKIPQKDTMDEDAEWLASVLGQSQENAPQEAIKAQVKEGLGLSKTTFFHLIKWSGLWFIFSVWAMWHYGPGLFVSRRMANLAYVVWVCAFNSAQLLLFYLIEAFMFPDLYKSKDRKTEKQRMNDATSKVMKAFNRNGLAMFLLANLLTGGINMSMKTLFMSDVQAMIVLVSYIGAICATALLLDHYDVPIKL